MNKEQRIGYVLALRDMTALAGKLADSGQMAVAETIAAVVTFLLLDLVEQETEANRG